MSGPSELNVYDLELLSGKRGNAPKPKAAVRRGDLSGLPAVTITSEQLTDPPTMDDYNALQADVAALGAILTQLRGLNN